MYSTLYPGLVGLDAQIASLQRINGLLCAVQFSLIVRRRIVKQCIPIGHSTHRARLEMQSTQRRKCHQCQHRRAQHLHQAAHMQDQLGARKVRPSSCQINRKPVQYQRHNGHKTQIHPIVGRRIVQARHTFTIAFRLHQDVVVVVRDTITGRTSTAFRPAQSCVDVARPATVESGTFRGDNCCCRCCGRCRYGVGNAHDDCRTTRKGQLEINCILEKRSRVRKMQSV